MPFPPPDIIHLMVFSPIEHRKQIPPATSKTGPKQCKRGSKELKNSHFIHNSKGKEKIDSLAAEKNISQQKISLTI